MPSARLIEQTDEGAAVRDYYDVVVIGAGIAGVTAAAKLALTGHEVLLIASHARHPREFRAEKFGQYEAKLLDRLGLWRAASAAMTSFDEVQVGVWGRIVKRVALKEYSTCYPDFIDALRAAVPRSVDQAIGRVERIDTDRSEQAVVFADGRIAKARLVVLATGLLDGPRRQLGIHKVVVSKAHSLIYGFDLSSPQLPPRQSLTWNGEHFGDGIAYLTLFPLDGVIRANLFTHWDATGSEARAFMADPAGETARRMPRFTQRFGRLQITGEVAQRGVDLLAVENHHRDGVVLVGDAFCTSCPSTGTGIRKVLTDVDCLVAHVPKWLATPGMGADKIGSYYADPVKVACDQESVRMSLVARSMLVDRSPAWRFRRLRSYLYRRGRYELRRLRFGGVAARAPVGA